MNDMLPLIQAGTQTFDFVDKTYIEFSGIQILEPVTALTNLFLALWCFWCFKKLKETKKGTAANHWKFFFLFLSCSTFIGIITHGAKHYLASNFTPVWLFMNVLSGLAVYFAEKGTIKYFANTKKSNLLNKLVLFKLVLLIFANAYFKSFLVVVINTSIGFLSIVYFKFQHYLNNKSKGSGLIATGILFAIFTGFIYGLKLSFNKWFNHNDISHIVMMISTWYIFIGVIKIEEEKLISTPLVNQE